MIAPVDDQSVARRSPPRKPACCYVMTASVLWIWCHLFLSSGELISTKKKIKKTWMAVNGLDISSELPCKLMHQRIQSFAVFVKVFSCSPLLWPRSTWSTHSLECRTNQMVKNIYFRAQRKFMTFMPACSDTLRFFFWRKTRSSCLKI